MSNFLLDELGIPVVDEDGKPVPTMHGGLGRWGNLRTPHTEWKCAGVFNIGDVRMADVPVLTDGVEVICQMCETARITYVYTMKHPTCPETLYVGSECAGHMSGDPQRMDDMLGDAKAIREAIEKYRGEWEVRPKGGYILRTRGFRLVVQPRTADLWSGWFVHTPSSEQWRTPLLPLAEVQREAVAYMVKARREIGRRQRELTAARRARMEADFGTPGTGTQRNLRDLRGV